MRSLIIAATIVVTSIALAASAGVASAKIDPNTVVACPGGEIEPFVWSVLKGPRIAEKDRTASAWLLRKIIREKYLEFMPKSRWFVIAKGRNRKTDYIQYASGDIDALTSVTFTRRVGKKRWAYSHSGHGFNCDPRLLTGAGRAATPWYPVPNKLPTNPASRSIWIAVSEESCNSGMPATGRVFADAISYTETEVRIRADIRPESGDAACPSNPPTFYEVPLTEAIGDRAIVDTARAAPRTRASTKQLLAVRAGADPNEELLFDKSDIDFCRDGGPSMIALTPTKSQQRRWYERHGDVCPGASTGF